MWPAGAAVLVRDKLGRLSAGAASYSEVGAGVAVEASLGVAMVELGVEASYVSVGAWPTSLLGTLVESVGTASALASVVEYACADVFADVEGAGDSTAGVLLAAYEDEESSLPGAGFAVAAQLGPLTGVARAGPDWMGLQPGKASRTGDASSEEVLMEAEQLSKSASLSLFTFSAPKHCSISSCPQPQPQLQPPVSPIAFLRTSVSHPFNYSRSVVVIDTDEIT